MAIHVRPVADQPAHIERDPNGILLAAVLAEANATATDEQERNFLLAIGRRLAESFPLQGRDDLGDLQVGMNEIWNILDVGQVELSVDKTGIAISHSRSPARRGAGQERWEAAEPIVLEAIYGCWFGALGNDRLSIKCIARSQGRIEFHYGR